MLSSKRRCIDRHVDWSIYDHILFFPSVFFLELPCIKRCFFFSKRLPLQTPERDNFVSKYLDSTNRFRCKLMMVSHLFLSDSFKSFIFLSDGVYLYWFMLVYIYLSYHQRSIETCVKFTKKEKKISKRRHHRPNSSTVFILLFCF